MEKNTPLPRRNIPVALTIAGSDSGGGAGIQADLRTFAAFQVHGLSAITSVTAQDTSKVHDSEDLSPSLVGRQIEAVLTDIGADAVKTGMLSSSEIIITVVQKLSKFDVRRLVVDPVMASTGGDALIKGTAIETLKRKPASAASMIESAAKAGGTNIRLASAPVASAACRTVSNTGNPRWVVPPLPGVTPPTMAVP